ncbi:MAG: hypothetical protein IKK18_01305 [Clostridia bacterium]|nr:hypothetical protein [Clostridia bacterium]
MRKQTIAAPDRNTTDDTVNEFLFEFDILNKTNSVASATECTGLMPRQPQDIDEAYSYTDIYVVPEQINYEEKKLRR